MERAALTIYLIVLILSPLLFGAVHTYAYTLMALGILTGSFFLVIKNIKKDRKTGEYQFHLPNTSLNLLFVLLLVFLFFQVIPLPEFIIKLLSPEALVIKEKSIPASMVVIDSNKIVSGWFALSPYYYPVRISIIRWTIYGLFFLGLSQLLNSRKRIELAIFLILMTCCFEALYGLAQAYSGSGHIWWVKANKIDVSGTYINRNHLAGLMEMGLLLAVSYSAALAERKRKRVIPGHKTGLRVRLSRFLSGEQRFNKRSLILYAGVVMGIGLLFSASRGGMVAVAAALLFMGVMFIVRGGHRRKGIVILLLFLITSTYALHIGVEYPLGRFKTMDTGLKGRAILAQKTLEMYEDYRLTGVGVGNFGYAYARYQPPEFRQNFVRYAHNDWIQFLAEAGIMGFCLFLAGISYYLYRSLRLWAKRSDPFAVCLGFAPLPVMTAMAIHSYYDFNLHIPANFLMLVAIIAIGYSALHLDNRYGTEKTLYRHHAMPLKYRGMRVLLPLLVLMGWSGLWTIRHFVAEAYCNTVHNSTLNRDRNPPLEEIKEAIWWDGWNAAYWYKKARQFMRMRDEMILTRGQRTEGRGQRTEVRSQDIQLEITKALEEAVELNPFEAEYHIRLGLAYTFLWRHPDYYRKWLPAADLSMERAAFFVGEISPEQHVNIGNYWIYRSITINPGSPRWEIAWNNACRFYKNAQRLEKRKSLRDKIMKYVWKFYPDQGMVREVLLSSKSL